MCPVALGAYAFRINNLLQRELDFLVAIRLLGESVGVISSLNKA